MILSACSSVSQPVSSYKELIETNFVVPVTILAASIWIFLYLVFLAECNYLKQHLRIQVLA